MESARRAELLNLLAQKESATVALKCRALSPSKKPLQCIPEIDHLFQVGVDSVDEGIKLNITEEIVFPPTDEPTTIGYVQIYGSFAGHEINQLLKLGKC